MIQRRTRPCTSTRALTLAVALSCAAGAASCDDDGNKTQADAGAPAPLATTGDFYGEKVDKVIQLEQGWSAADIEWFYTTTQGSELMPYATFINLEQADSTELFRSPRNMSKYRYLTDFSSKDNPDGLPVGFVKNGESIGLTCATCHTNQVNYKGTGIRIEGGPTMADFGTFMRDLIAALDKTLKTPEKLERFSAQVLGAGASAEKKAELVKNLTSVHDEMAYADKVNTTGASPYGFARLDAFGRIYNRAITIADRTNANPANAPASYPFLWDTSQHDYVQWVGNAPNANVGELQRNIGEVIGVFGSITIPEKTATLGGYKSSINVKDLNELAAKMRDLESPLWPEGVLGAIDKALAEKGAAIWGKECGSCHLPINRSDPKRVVRAQMYGLELIKTDPTMANNITSYKGKTGILEGRKELVITGPVFGPEAPAIDILTNLVAGVLEANVAGDLAAEIQALRDKDGGKAPPKEGNFPTANPLLAYKARPLNGVWATAPFLHNGSVPTLYDLLLPPDQRPKKFFVGRREMDVKKVGFSTDQFEGGSGAFELDTSVTGNSNAGHEYGTALSDDDRWALIEYMKTL